MISRRLRIHGLVQGVSYRDWAVRAARARGLTGWVRNLRDGSVEALVVGAADAVEAFTADCARGPVAARVNRVDQQEEGVTRIEGFTVRASAG
jgi:acylphosphatase